MEKLSKQTFELLCFISNYKSCSTVAALRDFKDDAGVTRKRLDELISLGLVRQHEGIFLIVTPAGRKLIADTADKLAIENKILKLNFNKDVIIAIVSAIIGALIQKVLDYF